MTVPVAFCAPLHAYVPEHVGTYGDEVADLAESAGLALDPEQRLVLDAMYAHDARGRLAVTEIGCAAPRQNLKTHVGKAACLADLVLFDEPEALWSAHLRTTSDKTHAELVDIFDNYDHLRRLVHSTPDSDGEKAIVLRRPGVGLPHPRLDFMTRSERGGRGLSGRRVNFDEALFLKPSMTAAMIPVLSAQSMSGMVQVRYLGSPGLLSSASWRAVRDRGRAGTAARLAWFEWAAKRRPCATDDCEHAVGTEGCVLDDPELVRQANLAIGRRMDIEFVMTTEREGMTPQDYMRERMGWWEDPPEGGGPIDLVAWRALSIGTIDDPEAPILGVDVALDRSRATIGAAWRVAGKPHVEVVDEQRGVDWVLLRLAEIAPRYGVRTVAVDGATEAAQLIPALEALGLKVEKLGGQDRAAACGTFYDLATVAGMTHNGDPAIADAIAAARWKSAGDGAKAFTRRGSAGSIAPLYAVVLPLQVLVSQPVRTFWGAVG